MYRITARPESNLIEIELGGLMTTDEVAAYIAELRRAFAAGRFRAGYLILIDVDACTIQSQEMIAAMREHMGTMPKARRIAMVTGSSLARMQVRRLMTQSYARIFENGEAAREWLLSPPDDAQAA